MKSFCEISRQLIGRSYSLGQCDCFHIILDYLRMTGVSIPEQFNGITEESYVDLYKTDPKQAKKVMVDFLNSILSPVKTGSEFVGDIVLAHLKGHDPFLGIVSGNGTMIAAAEEVGVNSISMKYYKVMRVWKCRKQSQ